MLSGVGSSYRGLNKSRFAGTTFINGVISIVVTRLNATATFWNEAKN